MKPSWRLAFSPVLLAGLVLLVSLVLPGNSAHAQTGRKPARIGWISLFPLAQVESYLGAFRS
ncbi:hypothetical protein AB4156_40820, partial [Cupriavidus sp. 2MCAB6]